MPQIYDMGPTALLPFRRKACCGFFRPEKSRRLRPGLNPRTWVLKGSTLPLDHGSRNLGGLSRQIYEKCSNTKFLKKSIEWEPSFFPYGRTDVRTDMKKPIVALRNIANGGPKMFCKHRDWRVDTWMRFACHIAVFIKTALFWHKTPCSLVDRDGRFGGNDAAVFGVEDNGGRR